MNSCYLRSHLWQVNRISISENFNVHLRYTVIFKLMYAGSLPDDRCITVRRHEAAQINNYIMRTVAEPVET